MEPEAKGGSSFIDILKNIFACVKPQVEKLLKDAEKPSADVVGVSLKALSLEAATLAFDVGVKNPYHVPLPFSAIEYKVKSGAAELLSGNMPSGGTVEAKGSRTLQIPAAITFANIFNTLKGIRPGCVVPYALEAALSVDAPLIGRLTLPLSKAGELPIPAPPEVEVKGIAWRKLSLTDATANMQLQLGNNNAFDIGLNKLSYDLSLAGVSVVKSALTKPTTLSRGEKGILDIPFSFNPIDIGTAIFHILQGQGAKYGLRGAIDLTTPFGPLSLPFSKSGDAPFAGNSSRDIDFAALQEGARAKEAGTNGTAVARSAS